MKHLQEETSAPEQDVIKTEKPEETTAGGKPRTALTHRLGAKIAAFFLLIVMIVLTAASVAGGIAMIDMELYTTPQEKCRDSVFSYLAEETAQIAVINVFEGRYQSAEEYCAYKNIQGITIRAEGESGVWWQYGAAAGTGRC